MNAIAVPEKWVSGLDEKKFAKVARFELQYRIGSSAYTELPLGGVVSLGPDGLSAPTLSPGPLTVRDFLTRAYGLGCDHFVRDQTEDGAHPKTADLRIVLLDDHDKELASAAKRLHRNESAVRLGDGDDAVQQVTESANVLSKTVLSLGGHIVAISSVEARSRNEYESIMTQQMGTMGHAYGEILKEREKIQIDLVEAAEAKTRAEEEKKRLDLETELAQEKGFFDSKIGAQLGTLLITQLAPKLLVFVDGALATASTGLEKRKLKATAELRRFKRELEEEEISDRAKAIPDRPEKKAPN